LTKVSRVIVKGKKDGKATSYTYDRIGNDWEAGTALSIGAQMLVGAVITKKGVFAPEGCIEPQEFFQELKKRGLTILEKMMTEHYL
ncbi:MAG: hypothetical protein KAI09_04650, partial [Dehalococcoidales bacterium]|nr:hypothetical protein [Dehalococcoidales bacterium]